MRVWTCKILVQGEIPDGFDAPPRSAAIKAINDSGIDVVRCWSGWDGVLSEDELAGLEFVPDYPVETEK